MSVPEWSRDTLPLPPPATLVTIPSEMVTSPAVATVRLPSAVTPPTGLVKVTVPAFASMTSPSVPAELSSRPAENSTSPPLVVIVIVLPLSGFRTARWLRITDSFWVSMSLVR